MKPNAPWTLIEETESDGKIVSVFSYDLLEADDMTTVLFNYIEMR
jgi:hypothetical protein